MLLVQGLKDVSIYGMFSNFSSKVTFRRAAKANSGGFLPIKTDIPQPESELSDPFWVFFCFVLSTVEGQPRESSSGCANEGHKTVESDVDKCDEDQ